MHETWEAHKRHGRFSLFVYAQEGQRQDEADCRLQMYNQERFLPVCRLPAGVVWWMGWWWGSGQGRGAGWLAEVKPRGSTPPPPPVTPLYEPSHPHPRTMAIAQALHSSGVWEFDAGFHAARDLQYPSGLTDSFDEVDGHSEHQQFSVPYCNAGGHFGECNEASAAH